VLVIVHFLKHFLRWFWSPIIQQVCNKQVQRCVYFMKWNQETSLHLLHSLFSSLFPDILQLPQSKPLCVHCIHTLKHTKKDRDNENAIEGLDPRLAGQL